MKKKNMTACFTSALSTSKKRTHFFLRLRFSTIFLKHDNHQRTNTIKYQHYIFIYDSLDDNSRVGIGVKE